MRKISQAIIAATLILDVAVVFTFGLTVISSYEDGSLLPEPVRVNYSKGRVAGESTANLAIDIIHPSNGTTVSGTVTLRARTNTVASYVHFNIKLNSADNTETNMPATLVPGTAFDWEKTIPNMTDGYYLISAQAQSSDGAVLAISPVITLNVLNNNTTINTPSITLNSPIGGTISGPTNSISGTLSNFPSTYSIPVKEFQVWQNSAWIKNIPLTRDGDAVVGSLNTTELTNGDYTLKIRIVYNDGSSDNPLESSPVSVTINNTSAVLNSNSNTNATTNANNSSSGTNTNANTATSNTNVSIAVNTNTSSSNTNAGSQTTTLVKPSITFPSSGSILRQTDGRIILASQASSSFSNVIFTIRKTDEAVPQHKDASFDFASNTWKYAWDLRDFKDWDYEIKAIGKTATEEKISDPVIVIVQKYGFSWLSPNPNDKLSGTVVLKAVIDGIYEKDNKTPMRNIVIDFWQTGVKAPYPKYNGKAQQKPGTHEWIYEWKTINSQNGQYRLNVKIGLGTIVNLFETATLLIEVSNQTAISASTSDSLNSNINQNSNTASKNTSTATTNATTNGSINSSTANTANSNIALTQTNQNSFANDSAGVLADSDNDGLSDEKEAMLGTNPNSNDTDGDGLFDLEEVEVWRTNPLSKDTDGDGYDDLAEINGGYDPLNPPAGKQTPMIAPKPIEEPKTAGAVAADIVLVIERIDNTVKTAPAGNENINSVIIPATNESNDNANAPIVPAEENKIVLEGKGPANIILTIFIYSAEPLVVTVKTDDDGTWRYELDKKLDDGQHEAYVTITDDTGRIQYKSTPISFIIKEARAETSEAKPAFVDVKQTTTDATKTYLLISGIIVAIVLVLGAILALRRKSGNTPAI